jgi:hypothetical protein
MNKKFRKLTVIHADGSPDTVTFEEPDYKVLQRKVGGYIEHVQLDGSKFNGARVTTAYANEDDIGLGLQVNRRATALYQAKYGPQVGIVGDMVIVQAMPQENYEGFGG